MSTAEEKLSPEEKLLRVIQGGKQDQNSESAEAADVTIEGSKSAVMAASVDAVDEAGTPESKAVRQEATSDQDKSTVAPPRLQLADRPDAGGGAAEATAATAISPSTDDTETTVAVAAVPEDAGKRKRFAPAYGINVANKVLAIAILVVLLLTGFEIWSQVKASQTLMPPEPIQIEQRVPDAALPDLKQLLEAFSERALFAVIAEIERPGPIRRPDNITKGLSLLGLSKNDDGAQEAILMDEKANMHFLREGDDFEANGTKMKIDRIESDHVIFIDEWGRGWTIKP